MNVTHHTTTARWERAKSLHQNGPLCACGCGVQTHWRNTGKYGKYASSQCAGVHRTAQKHERDAKMQADSPVCPCGRGLPMRWNGKRYQFCSAAHHGLSARSILLTHSQQQMIIGTLLGDASAAFTRHNRNARLRIQHSTKRQLAYCQWKREQLSSITNTAILIRKTPKAFGKEIARFNTLSHPFILEQALKLYTPTKTVTREYLDQLDDFGMAVWWMDDGSTGDLATHSFTHAEQEVIQQYLLERWSVETEIKQHKKRQMWYISFSHPQQMHRIVMPHVIPSLQYKFGQYPDANGQRRSDKRLQVT